MQSFPFLKPITLALVASGACTSLAVAKEQSWIGYSCSFQAECVDTDACANTTFALDFKQFVRPVGAVAAAPFTPNGMTKVTTEYSNFAAFAALPPNVEVVNWVSIEDSGDMQLFTFADGIARYTIHMPASGIALYYQGTCEMVAS